MLKGIRGLLFWLIGLYVLEFILVLFVCLIFIGKQGLGYLLVYFAALTGPIFFTNFLLYLINLLRVVIVSKRVYKTGRKVGFKNHLRWYPTVIFDFLLFKLMYSVRDTKMLFTTGIVDIVTLILVTVSFVLYYFIVGWPEENPTTNSAS